MENEVVPELHLTRWLRCMMSREYEIERTLVVWDYIYSGIDYTKRAVQDIVNVDDAYTWYLEPKDDPFINIEFLSVAMIALIKEDLLESDFSMCLGLLMSYKEPEDLMQVLNLSSKVRSAILDGTHYEPV